MSTTPAAPEKATPPLPHPIPTAVREIPLDQIEPSPWNRKKFNPQALEDLAVSIMNTSGVLQPVVMRPVAGRSKPYQLVAGERRWLASKIARDKLKWKHDTITATVREMSDALALEATLTENAQREDVPVLELCRTYKALLEQKDSTTGQPYTRELIAERVGKSYSLVCAILNADEAIPEVQKAAWDGKISDSLVLEIAPYSPKDQERIFLECFDGARDDDIREYDSVKDVSKDKNAQANVSVRQLREWIAANICIDLTKAPFKTNDELLLKGVPSCVKCPKRTGSNPGLFAGLQEIKKGDTCTDGSCFEAKKQAFVQLRIAEEQRKAAPVPPPPTPVHAPPIPAGVKPMGPGFSQSSALAAASAGAAAPAAASVIEIQKISHLYSYQVDGEPKKDVLYSDQFNLAKPGCKKEKKAIWESGLLVGQVAFICDVKSCSNHNSSTVQRDPISFERRVEIWNQKVEYVHREEMAKLIWTKLPGKIGDVEAQLISEHILKTLPHRDHEKVGRVLGLNDSDPESLELYMRKLKPQQLMRFIVICALVGDLGVDGIAFGDPLDKNSPLIIASKAYGIDHGKLLEAAKAQLESKRPKSEKEKQEGAPAPKDKAAPKADSSKAAVERANKAKQKSKKKVKAKK